MCRLVLCITICQCGDDVFVALLGPTVSLLTTSPVVSTLSCLVVRCNITKRWHNLWDESDNTRMFSLNCRNISAICYVYCNVRLTNKIKELHPVISSTHSFEDDKDYHRFQYKAPKTNNEHNSLYTYICIVSLLLPISY